MLKKLITLLMLCLLISHGIIQFTLFKFFQAKYKADAVKIIINGVPSDELDLIKIKISDIQNHTVNFSWKDESEFMYQNQMYDLIKEEIVNDSVLFYCLRDDNESRLYSVLEKLLGSIFDASNDNPNEYPDFNNYLSTYYAGSYYYINNCYPVEKNFDNNFLCKILEVIIQINTPPPNFNS